MTPTPQDAVAAARPLLERLADAVLVVGLDGRILFANRAARALYGWGDAEVVGRNADELVASEADKPRAKAVMEALFAGRAWTGEFPLRRLDGGRIVVQTTNTPLRDAKGNVHAVIGVARDVTAASQAHAALADRERQMAEAEVLAGLGSWTWEPPTNRVTWSRGLYEIYGIDPHVPATVEAFMDRIHPDDRAAVASRFEAVAADEFFGTQYRIVRDDGTVRWTASRGRVVEVDAQGNPLRVAGVTLDLTDDREALERIETLHSIASASDDAMFTTSLDGTITSWNAGAERLYGYAAEEAVGRSMLDTIVPADLVAEAAGVLADVSRGERVAFPITMGRRRDDRAVPVALVASPVRDADGEVAGAAVVNRDVSDQLLLLQQAGRATKLDAMGQLAAAIAHDFANVLTAVGGFARVARDKAARGEDPAEDLRGVEASVASGARLVNRLLGFVAPGEHAPLQAEFDVGDVVADVLPVLERLAGDRVAVKATEGPPVRVRGDADLLEQALVNLVINARDAMPEGGAVVIDCRLVALVESPATTVVPLEPGCYAAITVSDDGAGMDDVTLHRCVDPFFTTKASREGRGLGLASVVGAMRANGGSVEIVSTPGRGTEVTLYWPAVQDRPR